MNVPESQWAGMVICFRGPTLDTESKITLIKSKSTEKSKSEVRDSKSYAIEIHVILSLKLKSNAT